MHTAIAWSSDCLTETGPADRPLTKGERTREKILRAAEGMFARYGYKDTTLRDIAAEIGIQQPGIYNYFETKEVLYNEVLTRMIQPLLSLLSRRDSGSEQEQIIVSRSFSNLLLENPNVSRLLIRAFLSDDATEREIAMKWVEKVLEGGPPHRAGRPRAVERAVRQMALFNAWIGYFWTAPMIERLTGKSITDPELLDAQKDMLAILAKSI
jgi:AcrR family transcriptional regulator